MRPESVNNPLAAGRWMMMGVLLIALIDNFVGQMSAHISLWQFFLVRMLLALPLVVLLSQLGMGTIRPGRIGRVMIRGTLVAVAMLFYFGSLGFVTISQALAGLFTSPIFVLLISVFLLKKPVGIWRIAAVIIGFLGILAVIGPNFSTLGWTSLLPLMGGIFYACGVIATRELCEGEGTLTMVWSMFVMQGVFSAIALLGLGIFDFPVPEGSNGFLLRPWVWDMSPVIWIIVVQAIGSVVGVFFMVRAYQLADATYVAVFEYTIFIFGPLFAYLLWQQGIGWAEGIGIGMIAASGIIIAFRSPSA